MGSLRVEPELSSRLGALSLNCVPLGATGGALPQDFHHLREQRVLGTGRALFEQAATRLLTWRVHADSGLDVLASRESAVPGAVVELRSRIGPVVVRAPCRVVASVDEPSRRGFTYGTLAGHPESGEESFAVAIDADLRVTATIVAFSRPASRAATLAGPIGRRMQARATSRYLEALASGGAV